MESLHDLLVKRHSIRRYTDTPVPADDVRLILEAALLAPTSKNARPWHFIAVDDKDMLLRLAECKPAGAVPLKNCKLAVVVAADSTKSDAWIEDAAIAAEFMQLQAEDLGLGCCWVQVRGRFTADGIPSEEVIQELLGMPETISVECIMTFGYKDEQRKPVDTSKLLWEKVHIGKWNPAQE
ncbi:MAG: nitroreductase family protein [Bacteroides sp.]|nr:nitroreductase family protein [Bacteroides sp.]MCM1413992.1 nitroreductase family protein [Bacteroides sp.]MCM1472313.1 nitroreductase family protein [Bacteroides sp.]